MNRGACLVTGGAGFIGCALSGALSQRFSQVVAFDNLHPQVHPGGRRPRALDASVALCVGDVAVASDWEEVVGRGPFSQVIHLASETGTGQSLTEPSRHALVNVVGTARLVEALAHQTPLPERLVLASSRAVYGEGPWRDEAGDVVYPGQRSHAMLARGQWDFPGLYPAATAASTATPTPVSIYGATKLTQEHILASWCQSAGVDLAILRLQNVFGPGQSPANPYTGIVPLFGRLAASGDQIPVFEDGMIVRDFVYVDDVVDAVLRVLDNQLGGVSVVDIGSGVPTTIEQLAREIARATGAPPPRITGQFRDGDVRFALAQIDAAADLLGWSPKTPFDVGLRRLLEWLSQVEN